MTLPSQLTPGPDHAAPTRRSPIVDRIRKTLVALAGFAATLLAAGVLDPDVAPWVQAGLAALTAAGVYAVPNAPAQPRTGDPVRRA